jgi:hypothetical protein
VEGSVAEGEHATIPTDGASGRHRQAVRSIPTTGALSPGTGCVSEMWDAPPPFATAPSPKPTHTRHRGVAAPPTAVEAP